MNDRQNDAKDNSEWKRACFILLVSACHKSVFMCEYVSRSSFNMRRFCRVDVPEIIMGFLLLWLKIGRISIFEVTRIS